jgi:hypothetical protein
MPKRVDFMTESMFCLPRCLVTKLSGTNSWRTPAKRSPKSMKGAIELLNSKSAVKNSVR